MPEVTPEPGSSSSKGQLEQLADEIKELRKELKAAKEQHDCCQHHHCHCSMVYYYPAPVTHPTPIWTVTTGTSTSTYGITSG